jgi:hypothetical protein
MINLEDIREVIIKAEDNEIDVTLGVASINIYQGLYDPFVTGDITIIDDPKNRITKNFRGGIVGKGEEITLKAKTKTKPITRDSSIDFKKYYIYKVSMMPLEVMGEQGIFKQATTYHFCSKPMIMNELRLVAKSYKDKISNIVQSIAKEFLSLNVSIDEITGSKQKVIIPALSPIQAIMWLTSRAYSSTPNQKQKEKNSSKNKNNELQNHNFIFYEDIDHIHHFVSIGSLMQKEPVIGTKEDDGITIRMNPENSVVSGKVLEKSFEALQHYAKEFSPLSNIKNGMYASTCLTFDITRKQYAKTTMRYDELFKKQGHLYDRQLVDKNFSPESSVINDVYNRPETVIKYYPKCTYLYSEYEQVNNPDNPANDVHKWLLQRIASIEAMDQFGIDVEIKGNVGLSLGDVVFFGRPQVDSIDTKSGRDPFFTGKFLITRIKHTIESRGDTLGFNLRTTLSLRRDSEFSDSIDHAADNAKDLLQDNKTVDDLGGIEKVKQVCDQLRCYPDLQKEVTQRFNLPKPFGAR